MKKDTETHAGFLQALPNGVKPNYYKEETEYGYNLGWGCELFGAQYGGYVKKYTKKAPKEEIYQMIENLEGLPEKLKRPSIEHIIRLTSPHELDKKEEEDTRHILYLNAVETLEVLKKQQNDNK